MNEPTLILRVTQTGSRPFCAGAVWRDYGTFWQCIQTAPILHWMLYMLPKEAMPKLQKMGAKWEWIRETGFVG